MTSNIVRINQLVYKKKLGLIEKQTGLQMSIMLESIPGTNQYLVMRMKFFAQGNNGGL